MNEILHTGDNLEYMQTLPSESIDLIYSDILYGTGRDFGDYKDIMAKERNGYATQKPLALMERIIKASSNEKDTIADFFCGSGSFLVAGKKLNRNVIGCDLNPKAIEITKKRLNDATDLFNCC